MRKIIFCLILLLQVNLAFALFGSGLSILDVSELGKINIQINLTNKEEVFCIQGGNCALSSLNVTNLTVINTNVTDINVNGTFLIDGVDIFNLFWNKTGDNGLTGIYTGDYSFVTTGNINASIFNGRFNWTSGDDWTEFDGSSLLFNESKLATIFYNATILNVITGTGAGNLEDIQSYNDVSYNVTEDTSDFELRVNFSVGIGGTFNQLIIRYKSEDEDLNHVPAVQILDVDEDEWENYGSLPAEGIYHIVEFGVFDPDEHVDSNGVVQVRIFQNEGLPPKTHMHNFDWITISKGFGTPSGEEVDPFSIHSSGDVPWMGNENGDGFNSTGWNIVEADNFIGLHTGNSSNWNRTGTTLTPANAGDNLNMSDGNVTANYGFFDFLGSAITRITKGWFVNIDVSENVTAKFGNFKNITLNNSILTENGTLLVSYEW